MNQPRLLARSVRVAPMLDTENDHLARILRGPVQHAVGAATGRPDPDELAAERFADAMRVADQRGGEELDHGAGDRLGQALGECAGRGRRDDELVVQCMYAGPGIRMDCCTSTAARTGLSSTARTTESITLECWSRWFQTTAIRNPSSSSFRGVHELLPRLPHLSQDASVAQGNLAFVVGSRRRSIPTMVVLPVYQESDPLRRRVLVSDRELRWKRWRRA